MFYADRPILTSSQDLLGRLPFAKSVARSVLNHKNPESLVLALNGEEGVGKTSLLNLVMEELDVAANNTFDYEHPIIIRFNAHFVVEKNSLLNSFFCQLMSAMQSSWFDDSKKIVSLLEEYVSLLSYPMGVEASPTKSNWFKVKKSSSTCLESHNKLILVKKQLNELLALHEHKLIIVIDNISKLKNEAVLQIFEIIKTTANLKQTVYLLEINKKDLYQKLKKSKAQTELDLEQLIQVIYEVPPFSQYDIEKILLNKLQAIIKKVPEETWNKNYWGEVFYSSLRYFFKNTNDVVHYLHTLSFCYDYVKDIVNAIDYFSVVALELFAPEVYRGIKENKDLFTDLMDAVVPLNGQEDSRKKEEDKRRCDEIISRAKAISKEHLLHLLIHLFPRLRYLYESKAFIHSEATARKNRRVCSPDLFDAYFRMSLSSSEFSRAEFNAVMSIVGDEQGFALALLRLNQDERILVFLDFLDGEEIAKIPSHYISHVVDALLESGDLFPSGLSSPLSFNTPERIHRILHQFWQRIPSRHKRYDLFRQGIKKSVNSIYILVYELENQLTKHAEVEDTCVPFEEHDFDIEQLEQLKKLILHKIIFWAETGRLIQHPKLDAILHAWMNWGDPAQCQSYILLATQEARGLLAFLGSTLKEPIEEALLTNKREHNWSVYLTKIAQLVPPDLIEPRAKELFEDLEFEKLREREQLAILIFLDLMKSHTIKVIPRTSPE